MSSESQLIICRRCHEAIPTENGSCPHCGAGIRSTVAFGSAVMFGVLLIGATIFSPGTLYAFGILGLLVAASAGYLLYDKRQRIQRAEEKTV